MSFDKDDQMERDGVYGPTALRCSVLEKKNKSLQERAERAEARLSKLEPAIQALFSARDLVAMRFRVSDLEEIFKSY